MTKLDTDAPASPYLHTVLHSGVDVSIGHLMLVVFDAVEAEHGRTDQRSVGIGQVQHPLLGGCLRQPLLSHTPPATGYSHSYFGFVKL